MVTYFYYYLPYILSYQIPKSIFFIMSTSKPKPIPNLPKRIRDELRVTCALQGLAHMNEGNGMTVLKQYDAMFDYYQGKELSEVSQIKCLCKGIGCFSDLYYEKAMLVTNKKTKTKRSVLHLKESLLLDNSRGYIVGRDIKAEDLERKFSSSSLKTLKLVTRRQLHTYAKNAMANYQKALAYSKHVWNMDTMEKKDSGNTLDDVLLYVWTKMYEEEMRKKKNTDRDIAAQEEEEDAEVFQDITSNLNEVDAVVKKNVGDDGDDGSKDSKDDSEYNLSERETKDDITIEKEEEDEEKEKLVVPEDWFFPSYFAFVLWGPFVEPRNRLSIMETKDRPKLVRKSRAKKGWNCWKKRIVGEVLMM